MMHKPVLLKEVLEYLNPKPGENFVDCTCGEGGHTEAILERNGPNGKVLAIDWDTDQIKKIKNRIKNDRLIAVNGSYANLKEIINKNNFEKINGILLDLGFSSAQLESGRGFSFQKNEPLDMRYGNGELTASDIINNYSQSELEKILREYGEEKFSKKIAKEISEQRKDKKIEKTEQLVQIIGSEYFARRAFQALRIAVNRELENLQEVLPQIAEALEPEGRVVIISFHSLEDRIVKNYFSAKGGSASGGNKLKIINKKPVTASDWEIGQNPRAKSAKLRAAYVGAN